MTSFDRFAGSYTAVLDRDVGSAAWFADGKARWLADHFGAAFAGALLDFGCGVGLLAGAVRARLPGARLVGFDISADCVAQVPADLAAWGRFCADPAAIGEGFDAIVVANVLHHIAPADRDAVIADLAGRLAPGGQIVVFEHNPANPATRWIVAHCAFDDGAILLWPREVARRFVRAGLVDRGRAFLAFAPPGWHRLARFERHLAAVPVGAQFAAWGQRR